MSGCAVRSWATAAVLFAWGLPAARAQDAAAVGPFADAIATARARVVKLYGGAIGVEKAYGCGVVISADGRIVTALSVLLEGRSLRAVLPDGRMLTPRVLARDERRQLALLKVDAEDLPHFELGTSAGLEAGDWVLAVANPFKVADGSEPASIAIGTLSGRATLAARHRARDFSYEGPVLLTDLIVTTPGSAGGALVDAEGRLVGVIGRAVISRYTNTWVNYALPVEEVAGFVANGSEPARRVASAPAEAHKTRPSDLGIQLFDVGGRIRPAYVERVRPGSPAWKVGLRANDLLMSVNGQAVATCEDVVRLVGSVSTDQPVALVVKRGDELKVIEVAWEATP